MKYNPEQRKAIYGEEPLIVVAAGAGSGKTKVLSERYVHLCDLKLKSELGFECNQNIAAEVSSIVTLTFTEDAALEMKDRIRQRLMEKRQSVGSEYPEHRTKALEFWKKQIEDLDNAIISTFHSFCQRIVTENSFEANVFPNVAVLDEIHSKLLKVEIFSAMVEEAELNQQWPVLLKTIHSKSLQESLFSVYGKVREYELRGSLHETLHVEALLKHWQLMKQDGLEQFESEFYAFFQSRPDTSRLTKANQATYDGLYHIFQQKLTGKEFIEGLRDKLKHIKNTVPVNLADQNGALYNLLQNWLAIRELLQQPEENQDVLQTILREFAAFFINFDEKYETKKRESAVLDFSDLQQKAIMLLDNQDTQNYYSALYKHFLVDEFQDTNQLQLRMIEKINPAYKFIVGDGKQSIYRFRGADVQLLNGLGKTAKENHLYSFVDMNTNYRTCDSIIKFVNLLFEQPHIMGTNLGEAAPLYKTEYSSLEAARNDEKSQQSRVEYIKVTENQEDSQNENQYAMIARRMVQLKKEETEVFDKDLKIWRPVEWRDMSVLMASRTNLTVLEKALKNLDIPYNVYGGLGFYNRQEVVDFLSLLHWLNRPYEPLYIMAVLRSPIFGVTMEEFLQLRHLHGEESTLATFIYQKEFRNHWNEPLIAKLERFCELYENWAPFSWTGGAIRNDLHKLLQDSGLKNILFLQKNNLMKLKNVEKVIETISDLNATSMEEMLTKISIIAVLSDKEGDADVELTGGDFVHVMTVHGSKGLEFPVVFVPNLSRSLPADRATFRYDNQGGISVKFELENEDDLLADGVKVESPNFQELASLSRDQEVEESKRLLYVALTRARDLLILTTKYKEEEKTRKKDTWYAWLEEALENNQEMQNYIQWLDPIPEEKASTEATEIYQGPSVKVTRAIPITFSVSEVMSYINDSQGYIEKHLLKLDPIWLADTETESDMVENIDAKLDEEAMLTDTTNLVENRVQPTILGTAVHRICELLDKGYQEQDAYRETFTNLIPQGEEELYLKQVRPLVQSYQNKDFGQPIANEWEFVLEIAGAQIIGEIDKVVQKDDQIEVIDLKTNRIHDNVAELISHYKSQLYLYKMAYEAHNRVRVDTMTLAFLRDPGKGTYQIQYEPAYQQQIIQAITEMTQLKAGHGEGSCVPNLNIK